MGREITSWGGEGGEKERCDEDLRLSLSSRPFTADSASVPLQDSCRGASDGMNFKKELWETKICVLLRQRGSIAQHWNINCIKIQI